MTSSKDGLSARRHNLLLWLAFGLTLLMAPALLFSYPGRPAATQDLGHALNWVVWIGFVAELAVRPWWGPDRKAVLRREEERRAIRRPGCRRESAIAAVDRPGQPAGQRNRGAAEC